MFACLIMTSAQTRWRRELIERTWLREGADFPYWFFSGGYERNSLKGPEMRLACGDGYQDCPRKLQAAVRYALRVLDWTHLFLVDDDSYCVKKNLMKVEYQGFDLLGHYGGHSDSGKSIASMHGGPGFFLSRKAAERYAYYDGPWLQKEHSDVAMGCILQLDNDPAQNQAWHDVGGEGELRGLKLRYDRRFVKHGPFDEALGRRDAVSFHQYDPRRWSDLEAYDSLL